MLSLENNVFLDSDDQPNDLGQILKRNSLQIIFKDNLGSIVQMDNVEVKDNEGNTYNNQEIIGFQSSPYFSYNILEYEITNDNITINYNPYTITATKGETQLIETITTYPHTSLQVDVSTTTQLNFYLVIIGISCVFIIVCIALIYFKKKA